MTNFVKDTVLSHDRSKCLRSDDRRLLFEEGASSAFPDGQIFLGADHGCYLPVSQPFTGMRWGRWLERCSQVYEGTGDLPLRDAFPHIRVHLRRSPWL